MVTKTLSPFQSSFAMGTRRFQAWEVDILNGGDIERSHKILKKNSIKETSCLRFLVGVTWDGIVQLLDIINLNLTVLIKIHNTLLKKEPSYLHVSLI